jgi:hypothetical protein
MLLRRRPDSPNCSILRYDYTSGIYRPNLYWEDFQSIIIGIIDCDFVEEGP